jgi:catechol 2,3-dioxygenase-like lactoylglutathione lyase family enzyme
MTLAAVTFLVRDYDEAIAWFVDVLGFALLEDTPLTAGKRWVRVASGDQSTALLLAQAANDEQRRAIGRAAGGRVAYFLYTKNFDSQHASMIAKGVTFTETPRVEVYGKVAVFKDLYGNLWDLIGPQHNHLT